MPPADQIPPSQIIFAWVAQHLFILAKIYETEKERETEGETELEGTAARNDTLNRKKNLFENPKEKKLEIILKKEIEFIESSIGKNLEIKEKIWKIPPGL